VDARWVAFLPIALIFAMGFAGKLLPFAHPVRVSLILVLWLTGTLFGLVTWNLVRISPDTPAFGQVAMRIVGSALGQLLWLWGFGAGFALSGRRAGLGRAPRLWSTRLGQVVLTTAVVLWLVAFVLGEVVRAR
jgi:hypothetical protein